MTDANTFATAPASLADLEPSRLAARLGLLDAGPHESFDRLTRMLAAQLPAARTALVLHDLKDSGAENRGRQSAGFVLSHHGSPEHGARRREQLPAEALLPANALARSLVSDAPLAMPGLLAGPVFCEQRRAGTLWALAEEQRQWSEHQLAVLADICAIAGSELDLRSALHDRDRAEVALQNGEQRIRNAFDMASVGMIVTSMDAGNAGTLVRVNHAACEFLGRHERELVGLHFLDITHPDDRELSQRLLEGLLSGERSFARHVEKRYVHADGHTIWGELTTSVIEPLAGRPPYLISIVEDISERKQAELDLPAIANVLRRILSGEDARLAIVQAALDIAGASSAHLAERADPGTLAVTASAGVNLLGVEVKLSEPSATARAFLTGEARFLADPDSDPLVSPSLVEMSRARSIMWQPIRAHEEVIGVLCVCWSEPIHGISARAARAVALLTDETAVALAHHEALQRLAAQATEDPLTGLPNRRAWDERLAHELAAAARRESPLTLGLLDIDHLRSFNDARGHAAGDRLLSEFARHARPLLRQVDMLARWGGGEFAVLLPDCPTDAFPASVLDRIRTAVPAGQSCSVGYATWNRTETVEHLLARAGRALYRAKAMGRDRALAADGELDAWSGVEST